MTATRMITLALAFVASAASSAHAAPTFPADTAFTPLRCGGAPMTDPFADDANALLNRDLVGDLTAPTGLRAADDQLLYLRIRLDRDPAPAGVVAPFSWGMEFDLDGDRTTYELLILVDGTGGPTGTVSVFKNMATTIANDGSDPADTPAAQVYTFPNNARTVVAPGSSNGGDPDFFLDFELPWSALRPLGLDHDTPTYVWVASSSSANSLDGDFACDDGRAGPAHLDSSASDPTTGDPANDVTTPNGLQLEGGGGCAAAGGSPGACAQLMLIVVCALRRRRHRRDAGAHCTSFQITTASTAIDRASSTNHRKLFDRGAGG